MQPWESNELRPPGLNVWLNSVKASVQTRKILAADVEISSSCSHQHKPRVLVSVLIKASPCQSGVVSSFLPLSLPSVYGASFRFHPETPKVGNQEKAHSEIPLEYLVPRGWWIPGGSPGNLSEDYTASKKGTESELQRLPGFMMYLCVTSTQVTLILQELNFH